MKWEWYMISLIKYIDICDKRLCGKVGFHYLYVIYKTYYKESVYLCISNPMGMRSDVL